MTFQKPFWKKTLLSITGLCFSLSYLYWLREFYLRVVANNVLDYTLFLSIYLVVSVVIIGTYVFSQRYVWGYYNIRKISFLYLWPLVIWLSLLIITTVF